MAWCPGPPAVHVSVFVVASAEVLTKEQNHSNVSIISPLKVQDKLSKIPSIQP